MAGTPIGPGVDRAVDRGPRPWTLAVCGVGRNRERPLRVRGCDQTRPEDVPIWIDPAYAEEPLDRLRRDYIEYLKGRPQSTLSETRIRYNSTLLSFVRFLERQGGELVLGFLTPEAVNARVNEQRTAGRPEDGIASCPTRRKAFASWEQRYFSKPRASASSDLVGEGAGIRTLNLGLKSPARTSRARLQASALYLVGRRRCPSKYVAVCTRPCGIRGLVRGLDLPNQESAWA